MDIDVLISMAKVIAIFGAIPLTISILATIGQFIIFLISSFKGLDTSFDIKPTFILNWLLLGFFISVIFCL